MRTFLTVALLLLAPITIPNATHAQQAGLTTYPRVEEVSDLVPAALEVYSSSDALTTQAAGDVAAVLVKGKPEVLARPPGFYHDESGTSDSKGASRYLPVLYSALVPGIGELTLGYKGRGIALIALEVTAWTGYFYYRDQGLESRKTYEAFADAHWDFRKWIDHHPDVYDETGVTLEELERRGRDKSGTEDWPGYSPWVSKEEDKQHFYENIGKYDWYISGWTDFDPEVQPWMRDTPLRDQYRALRRESNDQLDDSNKFIYMSLGLRVFSIVETLFLVRSSDDSKENENGASSGLSRLRVESRPKGLTGGEIALEYRF